MCHGRVDGLQVEAEGAGPVVHVPALVGGGGLAEPQPESHRVHQPVVRDPELLVLSSQRLERENYTIKCLTASRLQL